MPLLSPFSHLFSRNTIFERNQFISLSHPHSHYVYPIFSGHIRMFDCFSSFYFSDTMSPTLVPNFTSILIIFLIAYNPTRFLRISFCLYFLHLSSSDTIAVLWLDNTFFNPPPKKEVKPMKVIIVEETKKIK